jgi:hypothetical protein
MEKAMSYISHDLIESERKSVLDYFNYILSCLVDRIKNDDLAAMKLGIVIAEKKINLLALSYPKAKSVPRMELSDIEFEIKSLSKQLGIDE